MRCRTAILLASLLAVSTSAYSASELPALKAVHRAKRERHYLKHIFHQTKQTVHDGQYALQGNTIVLAKADQKQMQHGTKVIHSPKPLTTGQGAFDTQILVTKRDVVTTALFYAAKSGPPANLSVAVLNPAHEKPGDGVYSGKKTIEAALFRSTNYFKSLIPSENETLDHQLHGEYHVPTFGGIYSPHVTLFRMSQDNNFQFVEKNFIGIIASIPYNLCKGSHEHHGAGSRGAYIHGTKKKIRAILRIAARKGHNVVILNDFGCADRNNNPKVVSKLFRKVLLEREFKGVFKTIDFAIQADLTSQLFISFSKELHGLVQ